MVYLAFSFKFLDVVIGDKFEQKFISLIFEKFVLSFFFKDLIKKMFFGYFQKFFSFFQWKHLFFNKFFGHFNSNFFKVAHSCVNFDAKLINLVSVLNKVVVIDISPEIFKVVLKLEFHLFLNFFFQLLFFLNFSSFLLFQLPVFKPCILLFLYFFYLLLVQLIIFCILSCFFIYIVSLCIQLNWNLIFHILVHIILAQNLFIQV